MLKTAESAQLVEIKAPVPAAETEQITIRKNGLEICVPANLLNLILEALAQI